MDFLSRCLSQCTVRIASKEVPLSVHVIIITVISVFTPTASHTGKELLWSHSGNFTVHLLTPSFSHLCLFSLQPSDRNKTSPRVHKVISTSRIRQPTLETTQPTSMDRLFGQTVDLKMDRWRDLSGFLFNAPWARNTAFTFSFPRAALQLSTAVATSDLLSSSNSTA